ncbi:hypothetical protein AAF712_011280 [Marasmius tenuissimus]|uniref:Uncharacterized protein n=1 Tax=Marasmius tenuissimus TaxID=585030 RepID=A0ABR2ZKD8_9AGAR
MANPDGKNSYSNGNQPDDNELREELLKLSTEMLSQDQARARLKAKFNYSIGRSKYFTLMSKFNIPTPRRNAKTMPPELMKSLVLEKLDEDVSRRNGPNTIQNKLARDGVPLPRDMIRLTQKEAQGPAAAIQRMPGYGKPKIPRGKLLIIGPFQEIHTDGHEKYARQALRMGDCTIGIYGMRDHVGFIHLMKTVPDAREGAAVGHLHLDMIVGTGYRAAVQMTYDLGHKTKEMKRQQFTIREHCSGLDPDEFPVVWETKSTHNISIESAWKWFRQYNGIGIRDIIEQGKSNGIFIQSNPVHTNLFHWLFPKLVQSCLDDFIAYWNTHKIRKQNSPLSGITPTHAMECPEQYGMVSGAIDVPPDLIEELRSRLPDRNEVFRWVSDDFEIMAGAAYDMIGRPSLVGPAAMKKGWEIFHQMAAVIDSFHQQEDEDKGLK